MTLSPDFDIMMVGHFSRDWIVIDGHSRAASGGAIYYGCLPLSRLGVRVAIVTRMHPDDYALLEELKQEGIQVFAAPALETTSITSIFDSSDMEKRICKFSSFAGPFRPGDIPDQSTYLYLISPLIASEVDLALLKSLAQRSPIALDAQGFLRVRQNGHLIYQQWPEMAKALAYVTYLKVDRTEAELLTGFTDVVAAAHHLAAFGPREVMITQSSGVTVLVEGQIHQAPFTPRSLVGRTGRGDTCFATYLGRRLTATPQEATRLAAAITSLKQEQSGPWRGTLADVMPQ